MALSTYADLQSAVGSWLARDDLSANIPDAITLFEAHAARKLKVRPMETSTTLTPSSGSADLPSGYLGFIRATVTSDTRVGMEYVRPSYLQALYPTTISDTPRFFTIEGSALKTRSSDATGIEFLYYAKNTVVSSALNWLFTNHPDAYLFGTLYEMQAFTDAPLENIILWKGRRDEVMEEIRLSNFREGSGLAIRTMGAHP